MRVRELRREEGSRPSGSPVASPGVWMLCLGNKTTEVLKYGSLAGSLPQNMDQPSCHNLPTHRCLSPHCFQFHTQALFMSLKLLVTHSSLIWSHFAEAPTNNAISSHFCVYCPGRVSWVCLGDSKRKPPLVWGRVCVLSDSCTYQLFTPPFPFP